MLFGSSYHVVTLVKQQVQFLLVNICDYYRVLSSEICMILTHQESRQKSKFVGHAFHLVCFASCCICAVSRTGFTNQ